MTLAMVEVDPDPAARAAAGIAVAQALLAVEHLAPVINVRATRNNAQWIRASANAWLKDHDPAARIEVSKADAYAGPAYTRPVLWRIRLVRRDTH